LKKLLVFLAVAAGAGLAVWLYLFKTTPPSIAFAGAVRETLVDTLVTNGKAEPAEWIAVRSERDGAVLRVAVQKGQQIAKDAVLVEFDSSAARAEAAAAQARIEQARAELAVIEAGGRHAELSAIDGSLHKAKLELQTAQREVETLQRLVEKKAATPYELTLARDRVSQAQVEIRSLEQRRGTLVASGDRAVAQARLHDAELAAEAAKHMIAQSVIRAPLSGTVYSLDARSGAFLSPGDVVAHIGKLDHMKVLVYVDEPELGRVRAGMPVVITWDARPGKQWAGSLEKVPTEVAALGTRQVGEVVCLVDNPGRELLPGTNINASIRSQVVENALTIPKETLRRENGQPGVLLLEGDHVAWRPVKLGASSVTRIQVTEGLREGDRVALPTEKPLKSGDKVQAAK
jgi:HlyD family secretion protein